MQVESRHRHARPRPGSCRSSKWPRWNSRKQQGNGDSTQRGVSPDRRGHLDRLLDRLFGLTGITSFHGENHQSTVSPLPRAHRFRNPRSFRESPHVGLGEGHRIEKALAAFWGFCERHRGVHPVDQIQGGCLISLLGQCPRNLTVQTGGQGVCKFRRKWMGHLVVDGIERQPQRALGDGMVACLPLHGLNSCKRVDQTIRFAKEWRCRLHDPDDP